MGTRTDDEKRAFAQDLDNLTTASPSVNRFQKKDNDPADLPGMHRVQPDHSDVRDRLTDRLVHLDHFISLVELGIDDHRRAARRGNQKIRSEMCPQPGLLDKECQAKERQHRCYHKQTATLTCARCGEVLVVDGTYRSGRSGVLSFL